MKRILTATLFVVACMAGISSARAQTTTAQPMAISTPTTKILAIGTFNPGVDFAQVKAILPTEARETVDLYLGGKID